MKQKEVGIYELVKGIREELKRLTEDPEIIKNPLLNLKGLELELNMVVSKATEAGLKFFIVTAGGEYKRQEVSRVKLSFEPLEEIVPRKVAYEGEEKTILLSPTTLKQLEEIIKTIEED